MKIAINATILDNNPSGIGVCTINIIRGLCKITGGNDKLAIFTSYWAHFKHCGAEIRPVSEFVQPRYGKFAGLLRFLWTQLVYPVRLRKEVCDVIYNTAHHAVFLTNKPQIITIHDLLSIKFPSRYRLQYYYFRFIIPILLKKCAVIITVSENSKKDIAEYYGIRPEKIVVVHNSYDSETFRFIHLVDERIPSTSGEYILAVGASYPNKNIERVLEAYSKIIYKISSNLVIAGGRRQYIKILKARVNELNLNGRVTFLDYVESKKMQSLYSNAVMLVFPSIYEGFGIPPLEAMACGCPVVASNASSIPEVCGDAAFYVDPYNVESIADGICKVLTDERLRDDLIAKGFKRVKDFSWNESAKKILNIIKGSTKYGG